MAWGWWSERKRHDSGEWTGFLEQGVTVDGRLECSGTFRIDSVLKGTIVSKQTLIVAEHASIEGEIIGNHVVIAGRFDGAIRASGRVELKPNAIVTGEIHSPCVLIEPGAAFEGRCHITSITEAVKPVIIPIRSAAGRG